MGIQRLRILMQLGSTLGSSGLSALWVLDGFGSVSKFFIHVISRVTGPSALLTGIFVSVFGEYRLAYSGVGVVYRASIVFAFCPRVIHSQRIRCLAFNDLVSGTSLLGQSAFNADQVVCWDYHGSQYW